MVQSVGRGALLGHADRPETVILLVSEAGKIASCFPNTEPEGSTRDGYRSWWRPGHSVGGGFGVSAGSELVTNSYLPLVFRIPYSVQPRHET